MLSKNNAILLKKLNSEKLLFRNMRQSRIRLTPLIMTTLGPDNFYHNIR